MTATIPARKPRTRPERFARVLARFESGVTLVELEERTARTSKRSRYYVEALAADYGRAFRFEKFTIQGGEVYTVNVGGPGEAASCECLGHLRHGHKTVCKHVAAARALITAGKL